MGYPSPFGDKTAVLRLNPQLFHEVLDGRAARRLASDRHCG